MNLANPLRVVTPTLDGDILGLLARADRAFTGREIQRALPRASQTGVRHALARLVDQGIVLSEPAGRAIMFELNRAHLATPFVEGLATLWAQLLGRLRDEIDAWEQKPVAALLFGSGARGEATEESDLDLLVIRPRALDPDDDLWRAQLDGLTERATRWTGNDVRVLEYGVEDVPDLLEHEPVFQTALDEGIELAGSIRALKRMRGR